MKIVESGIYCEHVGKIHTFNSFNKLRRATRIETKWYAVFSDNINASNMCGAGRRIDVIEDK